MKSLWRNVTPELRAIVNAQDELDAIKLNIVRAKQEKEKTDEEIHVMMEKYGFIQHDLIVATE